MAKRKTSSKSKKKSTRKKKTTTSWFTEWRESIDWEQGHRVAVAGGWVAFLAVLIVGWVVGVPRLQAYAATADTGRAHLLDVRFVDKPAWVRGDLETRLRYDTLGEITTDPFSRTDLIRAQRTLLNTGWFTAVHQVTRLRDDLILVDADFVTPFAVVADSSGQHVVDPNAVLLPMTIPSGAAHEFVAVLGARNSAPSRPGLSWAGADVQAALRLLALLDQQTWVSQVRAIDLAHYRSRHQLVLVSDRGCRIRWGSPPGEEQALEAFADLKLSYLNHHFREHRHIDAGHHGEIDLTSQKAVTLLPPK